MENYSAGLLHYKRRILRPSHQNQHTAALNQVLPDEMLDTINLLHSVPWRINQWHADQQAKAQALGLDIGDFPVEKEVKMIDEEVWKDTPPAEKAKINRERWEQHTANNRGRQKRYKWRQMLGVAKSLGDRPIFFPWSIDFRGRMYPLSPIISPQGWGLARGVLEYAVGAPVTEEAMFWLESYVGALWGLDKKPFEERAQWTRDHWEVLAEWVDAPFETDEHWRQAKKPWYFLGIIKEYVDVRRGKKKTLTYPVYVDGTCNGYQHLSGLALDEIGGEAVNLTSNPIRQDIYQRVVDAVEEDLAERARAGEPHALFLAGKIDRDMVKRGTMTTPLTLGGV